MGTIDGNNLAEVFRSLGYQLYAFRLILLLNGNINSAQILLLYLREWVSEWEREREREKEKEGEGFFSTPDVCPLWLCRSPKFCSTVVHMWGSRTRPGALEFDGFLAVVVLVRTFTDKFAAKDAQHNGTACISYEEVSFWFCFFWFCSH